MCEYFFALASYTDYISIPPMVILLLLGILVLLSDFKSLINRIYFFLIVFLLVWLMTDYLGFKILNPDYLLWSEKISNVGLVAGALIALFIYVFPENKKITKRILIYIFLPLIPFLALIPSNLYIKGIGPAPECESMTGPLFWLMIVLILYYIFLGTVFSIEKMKKLKDEQRGQLKIFYIGTILLMVLAILIDILPTIFADYSILLFAPYTVLIFASFCAYAIVKYKALNVKVVAAQMLTVLVWILIFSEFFFITTKINFILTGITLALSVIFGIFLIKSVRNEVKRKEELQMMSEKLAMANDQLRKLDNAKSEFISIASHQLRTPLTAIKGFISLLLEGTYGKVEPKVRDTLNKVYLSNERMVQLVENLLNISRIESGRLEFDFKKWKVEEILNELRDTFFISAKSKGLSLDFKFPDYSLPETEIDGPKIREVISNLIDNALKYTNRGGVTVNAELITDNKQLATKNEQFIRITISDTGIGVPESELPYLFSKFSRGKDTKRLHVGGTGLGLYVGKSMIEAHHGKIWAESEGEGMGSKFIIEVPVSQEKFRRQERVGNFIKEI